MIWLCLLCFERKARRESSRKSFLDTYHDCQSTCHHSNHLRQKFKKYKSFFLQDPSQWNSVYYSSLLLASVPSRHLPDFSNDGPGPAHHPRPGLTPSPPVGIHTGNWYNVSASNNGTSTFQHGEIILEEKIELIRIHSYTIHNILVIQISTKWFVVGQWMEFMFTHLIDIWQ